jgi:hypothetical protein
MVSELCVNHVAEYSQDQDAYPLPGQLSIWALLPSSSFTVDWHAAGDIVFSLAADAGPALSARVALTVAARTQTEATHCVILFTKSLSTWNPKS